LNDKRLQQYLQSALSLFLVTLIFPLAAFTISCSAFEPQQTEEQALQSLRQMMKSGKLPPESVVLQLENRFPNTRTGALANILRAQIRLSANDGIGAANILDSSVFRQKTDLADYALWLRGKAFLQAARYADAQNSFNQLVKDFPNSLRAREAKLLWASAAMQNGQSANVPDFLSDLTAKNDGDALLAVAKAYEQAGNQPQAIVFYRKVYFYGAGTNASKEAEIKLATLAQPLTPLTAEEIQVRADKLFAANNFAEAQKAYDNLVAGFPASVTPAVQLKRVIVFGNLKNALQAQNAFNLIPLSAKEKPEAYYQLARAYANTRQWAQVRTVTEEMRRNFPNSELLSKTIIAVGMIARDQKNKSDETYFLRSAVMNYPNAVDVAQAQFELAWLEHDGENYVNSSKMLIEHLARYVDKDNTYRGRAGYWAARDSERAGQTADACILYDAVNYRYGANWYGYLAAQRIANLKALNKCGTSQNSNNSLISRAVTNLKTVTVAPETSGAREQEKFNKADQLSTVGLFDWAIEELNDAARTASNSPKVNLAVAKLYRLREDNVNAFLALARSYPDYPQMFPEEMSREEWDIFYPLNYWEQIKPWAKHRNLDEYQVAGLIRQESVFNPRARSGAAAYGLMQLLVPTARMMARKYGTEVSVTGDSLFLPALNIELGTAYMRDQFEKFGRIEFVAMAYNAGPGRVPQWQRTLPLEMDEFVEAIPFKETRAYVQGVIRNSAQYRRLYDADGKFKSNVGTRPLRGEIDSKPREQFTAENPEIVIDDSKTAE
jgi:soluble lytic murein transglycosylase